MPYKDPNKARERSRERYRRARATNPEKVRTQARERAHRWYARNLEKGREKSRLKRAENPKYFRRWRVANLDKGREYSRRWRAANPEKVREEARRKARVRGTWTRRPRGAPDGWARILLAFQGGRCAYCSAILPERGWHLEHVVPLSRGGDHVWENVVASCARCNLAKGTRLPEEFAA